MFSKIQTMNVIMEGDHAYGALCIFVLHYHVDTDGKLTIIVHRILNSLYT